MTDERVRLFGNGGTATLLAVIIRGNLAANPQRRDLLDGPDGTVRVLTTDTDERVGLEFRGHELRIYADATGPADVEVTGDTEALVRVLAAPRILGLPDPLRAAGRTAIASMIAGRVRAKGLIGGRRLAARVRGLLTT